MLKMIPVFHLNTNNITGRTGKDGTKNVEIWEPLKYLCNFWKNLEMQLP